MDRQHGKRQLRRLREKQGWSWTDLARAIKATARQLALDPTAAASLPSIRRTIARWESDTTSSVIPDDRYQRILAHLYAQRGDIVDVSPGSDFVSLLSAFLDMGIAPQRIAELQDAVLSWAKEQASTSGGIDQAAAGGGKLTELALTFTAITNQVGKVPFVRSQIALAPLIEAFRRLAQAGTALPSDARILAARTFSTAGRLAFELRDDDLAKRYYADALVHAKHVPERWLTASISNSLAMVTMHRDDNLTAAQGIANNAINAALDSPSMTVRARAFAIQAEIAARRKLRRPAGAALTRAEHYAAQATPDDPSGKSFDAARLAGFTGLYHLLADSCVSARENLDLAGRGIPEHIDPVQRSIVVADLAHAYLAQPKPEPDAAITALHECVNLVGRTRGRVATSRIRRVRQLLRHWQGERLLADLDEHLYTMLLD